MGKRVFLGYRRWFALAAVLFAIGVGAKASATVMVELQLEDLAAGSDVIVHGVVKSVGIELEIREHDSRPRTVTRIEVLEWLRGSAAPQTSTVTLREVGGTVSGRTTWIEGTPQFAKGEEVVVFLRREVSSARKPNALPTYRTFGMAQGKFTVRHGVPGVPSSVSRDLGSLSFASWQGGQMAVAHAQPTERMELDTFLQFVRDVAASLDVTRGAQ